MTDKPYITLKRVEALPARMGARPSSEYDELIMEFFRSDWAVGELQNIGEGKRRPSNLRNTLHTRIRVLGLSTEVKAAVRKGKVYLYKVERPKKVGRPPKRKEIVIEAGTGVRKGSLLEEEAV